MRNVVVLPQPFVEGTRGVCIIHHTRASFGVRTTDTPNTRLDELVIGPNDAAAVVVWIFSNTGTQRSPQPPHLADSRSLSRVRIPYHALRAARGGGVYYIHHIMRHYAVVKRTTTNTRLHELVIRPNDARACVVDKCVRGG